MHASSTSSSGQRTPSPFPPAVRPSPTMLSLLPIISFLPLITALPSLTTRQSTTTPYQIRGVEDPIYHLYLQSQPDMPGTPVMGPEATGEFFIIDGSIQSQNTSLYLNIGTSSTSYLPLTLDATSNTTAWGLEGDTIITTTTSSYGRQLNFLVCNATAAGYFDIYLQTGSDVPSDQTCSNYQTIHLPCLC